VIGTGRTHLLRALALTAALVVVAFAAAPAGARTNAMQISGNWSITSGAVVEQRQLGQLLFLRQQGTSAFTGSLVGTTAFDLRVFLRPDFSSFGWATEPFTGSLGNRAGGFDMLEWATGAADGSVRIDAVVGNGTGALRGIRGHITFVSNLCLPESCEGTYSGVLTG
jgi:hypothetical protein